MKGYVVSVYEEINDLELLKKYAEKASIALKKYSGKIIIRGGKSECKEGKPSPRTVIIEFSSTEDAKIFYEYNEYQEAKKILGKFSKKIEWSKDSYKACRGSDAVVILTEWNQFRALDLKKIKKVLKNPILIDLRNIYKPDEMLKIGLQYHSLGRP